MAENKKYNKFGSLQLNADDIMKWNEELPENAFEPASSEEKENFIQDRKSVSYWKDAWRRLRKNTVAMVALGIIILLTIFAFVGPMIVPYTYKQQIRGSEALGLSHYSLEDKQAIHAYIEEHTGTGVLSPDEAVEQARAEAEASGKKLSRVEEARIRAQASVNADNTQAEEETITESQAAKELGLKKKPFGYSDKELERKAAGEKVFPHIFGTDDQGRDIMVRVMVGTRVSITVGICAALLVLVIGALYGSISGYCGGVVDTVMQRIVEIIYSIPEMLIILLLSATLKPALEQFQNSGNGIFQKLVTILGPNLISMFIAFGLLYWVTMSRIIRGQILQLKQQEYVTAARALGAKGGRIIRRHLLPNCIGQIVTTTFLQIPSAIFLESFLSFVGVGVSAPLTSLGSMCSEALSGLNTYPYRLFIPAVILSLMILSLNLFGDGLRDALDPRLKK
ncbi:Oligopeptide transport system permease protein oppC [uncultured Clostridium sp.]|uniref:ABC transporter permease n=1 Tax=Muricoprocola aceti TaxID=2981772 RepID=A0ABT2SPC8_9FIRM|nr:ABC transporter permease [Muricoprocola aceti]MCQ4773932.1 ABC transporter permease [Lacrimispora saccharolytica]MDD7435712.1 ABC transporter permease [Lachnospiraceae bacterium]SCH78203.1 Oligopeptide transport system permease protein oppC [uncultured Clostridium sp.]MCU6726125.1 ABC transporter permease [Muricoprocola aceti]MDY3342018.1 ABC transporter permease [Lachnospiraceae bacterium]